MTPRKLKIGIARFPYAGNGGTQAEHPDVGDWLMRTVPKIMQDERCEKSLWEFREADTPITMVRNRAAYLATQASVDVLIMLDSDNTPDLYVAYDGKPFWDTSFDFLYKHYEKGPCIVAAPYSGPPPHPVVGGEECPYAFYWANDRNHPKARIPSLVCAGIQEVAAMPTGVIMIDTRVFKTMAPPWFYYEWGDGHQMQKVSTEDVVFTRNASLHYGFPVYCNWDSWAGHWKPGCVGKPRVLTVDSVREEFLEAARNNQRSDTKLIELNPGRSMDEILRDLAGNGQVQVVESFDRDDDKLVAIPASGV
jgi:hypothetical protein